MVSDASLSHLFPSSFAYSKTSVAGPLTVASSAYAVTKVCLNFSFLVSKVSAMISLNVIANKSVPSPQPCVTPRPHWNFFASPSMKNVSACGPCAYSAATNANSACLAFRSFSFFCTHFHDGSYHSVPANAIEGVLHVELEMYVIRVRLSQ